MKVVRLSALRTSHLYPPGNIPGTHFCQRLSQPQRHSAAGRIISIKNSNDTTGNRTCNLLTCSAVPQPTAPLCTAPYTKQKWKYWSPVSKYAIMFMCITVTATCNSAKWVCTSYGHLIIGSSIWSGKANITTSAVLISQGLPLFSDICHTHMWVKNTIQGKLNSLF
jgi:hypothetical protein